MGELFCYGQNRMKHSITNPIDAQLLGDCAICGPQVRIKRNRPKASGGWLYRCYKQYIVTKTSIERPYVFHKKDTCEECGFIPRKTAS